MAMMAVRQLFAADGYAADEHVLAHSLAAVPVRCMWKREIVGGYCDMTNWMW